MKKTIIPVVLLSVLLTACTSENIKGTPIEKIGNITICKEDLALQLPQGQKVSDSLKQSMLKQLEKTVVMYLAAKDEGMLKDPALLRKLNLYKRNLVAEEFLRRKIGNIVITDVDVENFLAKHPGEFRRTVNIAMVSYMDTSKTNELRRLLSNFSPYSQARLKNYQKKQIITYRPIPNANIGELGLYYGFNNPVVSALNSMKNGEVSQMIPMNGGGYALLKITDEKISPDINPQIKQRIKGQIQYMRQNTIVDSLYKFYLKKYKIQRISK